MLAAMSDSVFLFGDYRLDPAKRELECRGDLLTLTPHVFDCITYLVEHRDRAVGRDELIAAVWGRAEVSDTLLGQTIMHSRRAVGDSGEAQQLIRTIPRFGYRWVAEVNELGPAAVGDDEGLGAKPPPTAARDARTPGLRWLVVAVPILLLLVWLGLPRPAGVATLNARDAGIEPLLVLPVTVSAGPDTAWIPLGVMDAIASRLRESGWAVVPSSTVVSMASRTNGPSGVRSDLSAVTGSGLIIQPAARRSADGWVISLALGGPDGLPAGIDGSAGELLDAARLASDRLIAVLQRDPLPEQTTTDPDAALAELMLRIEAELLANRLEGAHSLLVSSPVTLQQRLELRYLAALIDYRAGRLQAAEQSYRALLAELEDEPHRRLRGRVLIGLGSIARTQVNFELAAERYREVVGRLDPLRDPDLVGTAQTYLGVTLASLGQFGSATQALAQARVLLVGTGDAVGVAVVDAGFASLLADRRRLADAAPRMAQAITQFELLGAESEAFDKRIALTQMYREMLASESALEASRQFWQQVGDDHSQRLFTMAVAVRAMALIDVGSLHEASEVLARLDEVDESAAYGYMWRQGRLALAYLHLAAGRPERASAALAGLPLPEAWDWPDTSSILLYRLRALYAQDDREAIAALLPRVEAWLATVPFERDVHAGLLRAELDWWRGDRERAYERFAATLVHADEEGVPANIVQVALAYGTALIADGRAGEAGAVVGRLAAMNDSHFESALLEVRLYQALGQAGPWRRALERARRLAGERNLPDTLVELPQRFESTAPSTHLNDG